MKLNHLEYFVKVCNLGSTMQAASVLNISQPAISSAIRDLEKEFGVLLFTRAGKRLEITEAGKQLYALAVDILTRSENAVQIMNDIAKKRNRIRLGITPMLACLLLPNLVKEYHERYPDVLFSFSEGGRNTLFQMLDDRELDMVICSANSELDAGYRKMRLLNLPLGICIHPRHPLAGRDRIAIRDLIGEPLAAFSLSYHQNQTIEKMFAFEGCSPNIVFRTSQLSTMWELVSSGMASCFLYLSLKAQRPDLCFLPLDSSAVDTQAVPIHLYWREKDFVFLDMKNLMECVKALHLEESSPPSGRSPQNSARAIGKGPGG